MSDEPQVKLPDCPGCLMPLDINGIDEQREPAVVVYSCPRCGSNYFQRVNLK
jgi:hypothetical protein